MNLLLIEDDEYKADQITNYLSEEGHSVDLRISFQSGMRQILSFAYDAILLDMSIPTFDIGRMNTGSRHRPFGGKDILQELKRRGLDIPVIVMTQYKVFEEGRDNITLQELGDNLKKEFDHIYVDMIYFDASSADWILKLKIILRGLEKDEFEDINS